MSSANCLYFLHVLNVFYIISNDVMALFLLLQ